MKNCIGEVNKSGLGLAPTEAEKTHRYSSEIDGLRALAVIAVIVNHFSHDLLPSGHLGVDIFFVISGYVITSSLYNRPGTNLFDFILNFYSRRMKRLVPALVVFVVFTCIAICLFNNFPKNSIKTGVSALFGYSNIHLLLHAVNYFGEPAQLNVFTHTWSLGVEEQFYLIFPFAIWFSGFGRRAGIGSRNLALVIGSFSVLSFGLFIFWSESNPNFSFFLMPARFWELGAGAFVFLFLNKDKQGIINSNLGISSIFLLLFILLSLFVVADYSEYTTIAIVLLTSLLIATIKPRTLCHSILAHPSATYVGRISYSLYLWHWGVLAISRWTVGIHSWSVPIQVGLMFLLADASYRYVENPLRRAKWSISPWKTITYSSGTLVVAASLLLGLVKPLAKQLYAGKPPKMAAVGVETLVTPYSFPDPSSTWHGEDCVLSDNSEVGKVIPIDKCTLGDFSNAKRRILVLGNSFSAAFVQAFDRLVEDDNYAVIITSSWGASPGPDLDNHGSWDKANDYYWGQVAPSLINSLHPGDAVFLVNDLADFSTPEESTSTENKLTQLEISFANLSGQLSSRDIGLAVLDGLPFVREANCDPATASKQWFAPFGGPCHYYSKNETISRRSHLDKVLSDLQKQRKIAVVDLMEVFCPGEICTYKSEDGQMLYRDIFSHPSVEAARLSAPVISTALTSLAYHSQSGVTDSGQKR